MNKALTTIPLAALVWLLEAIIAGLLGYQQAAGVLVTLYAYAVLASAGIFVGGIAALSWRVVR